MLTFLEFTGHLKQARPNNLTEIVALFVAVLMNNGYEQVQHERLSLKLGFGEKWLREALSLVYILPIMLPPCSSFHNGLLKDPTRHLLDQLIPTNGQ